MSENLPEQTQTGEVAQTKKVLSAAEKAFLSEVTAADIKLGIVTIKQKNSDLCPDVKNGSFIEATEERVIVGPGQQMRFIPFKVSKNFFVKDAATKKKLIRVVPAQSSRDMEWEGEEEGQKVVRIFCYTFTGMAYVGDVPVSSFPVQIHFASTFTPTAQALLKKSADLAEKGQSPFSKAAILSSFDKTGANGFTWWRWKIEGWSDISEKEAKDVDTWAMRLGQIGEEAIDEDCSEVIDV